MIDRQVLEFKFLKKIGGYLSPPGSALVSVSHSLAFVKFWPVQALTTGDIFATISDRG